ncbi:hypothetical protein CAEBREN_15087 [Caenorhabditis brenneri]|uniref:Uncharacterized protein n=1 Tax=Caenorhabditis brenneri TaxID=135651 RepID=G0MUP6_CAEBE|nr:hypothetical protein CAEBREN_15087 [Caenorhabditis brenneri]
MDSKRNEPKSAKSEKSPIQPFLLEITPEQLVVPSTGNLEVKIRNPTKESHRVNVYFDSFFWLMKVEGNDSPECRADDSNCVCYGTVTLEPGQSRTLVIGYHDAQFLSYYKSGDLGDCDAWCDKDPCPEHMGKGLLKVPPSERFYYNHERPEGFLVVKYQTQTDEMEEILHQGWLIKRKVNNFLTKRMDLQLKDETEEYKKYREQFLEIRKEQARRARWGHVLVNKDGVTERKFRDLNGTIRDYGYDGDKKNEWERDILPDLKQLDGFSDEQILKIRKERKEKIEEKHRKEEEDAKKRADEYRKEQGEKRKKEDEEIKKKVEEEEMKKKKKEKEEAAAAKEKSKVKTVEKSKHPEEPSQNVQKSTKSNVSVAPPKVDVTPTNNKPIGKPNVTKNKKKKANPCCSVM